MALDEKDQDLERELEEARSYLKDLPEIRLPASLTAENLFERLDELEHREEQQEQKPAQQKKKGTVLLWQAWRPVLSYAAVFVLLVAVYYGMGIDAKKPPQLVSNAAQAKDSAVEDTQQVQPQNEKAVPRTYAASGVPEQQKEMSEEAVQDAQQEAPASDAPQSQQREEVPQPDQVGPMLAMSESTTEQQPKENSADDAVMSYYRSVVQTLRQDEFWPETETAELPVLPGNEIVVRDGELYFRYKNINGEPNVVEIYQDKGLKPVSSFRVSDAVIIDLVPMEDRLAVVEQKADSTGLYTGELLEPLEEGSAADLPTCGAITVSVYDLSDLEQPRLVQSFTQDGRYLGHMKTEDALVVATRKHIELFEDQAALLCHSAPVIQEESEGIAHALAPEQVTAYPDETGREYVVLSSIDLSGEDLPTQTQAVLGSRLDVQLSPTAIFVLDSEAKENGGKPQAVFSLGKLEVQLR